MKITQLLVCISLLFCSVLSGCAQTYSGGNGKINPKPEPEKKQEVARGPHVADIINAMGNPADIVQRESGVEWCSWYWSADGDDKMCFIDPQWKEKDGVPYLEPGRWVSIDGESYTVTCSLGVKVDITGRILKRSYGYESSKCNLKNTGI